MFTAIWFRNDDTVFGFDNNFKGYFLDNNWFILSSIIKFKLHLRMCFEVFYLNLSILGNLDLKKYELWHSNHDTVKIVMKKEIYTASIGIPKHHKWTLMKFNKQSIN